METQSAQTKTEPKQERKPGRLFDTHDIKLDAGSKTLPATLPPKQAPPARGKLFATHNIDLNAPSSQTKKSNETEAEGVVARTQATAITSQKPIPAGKKLFETHNIDLGGPKPLVMKKTETMSGNEELDFSDFVMVPAKSQPQQSVNEKKESSNMSVPSSTLPGQVCIASVLSAHALVKCTAKLI